MTTKERVTTGEWVSVICAGLFVLLVVVPVFVLVMLWVFAGIKGVWKDNFSPPKPIVSSTSISWVPLDSAKKRDAAAVVYCKKHGHDTGTYLYGSVSTTTDTMMAICGDTIPDPATSN